MRRYICLFLVMILVIPVLTGHTALSQTPDAATPPAGATPTPAGIALILPTEEQVPNGLVMIDDGERSLQDVTSGFSDPAEAASMFMEWGWQRNVIRAFHTPDDTASDPEEIDGVYISIHEFGSPEAAAEALDYSAEIHQSGADLDELEDPGFGDRSQVLFGEESYGNEITVYAQQGNVVIRVSASSPEGDPTEEAFKLMTLMLETPYFEQRPS